MKLNDLQFVKYFLTQESAVPGNIARDILEKNIDIVLKGNPDTISIKGDTILYQNPSSITMFLFNTLYYALISKIENNLQKDKFGLGLLFACRDYVYSDFDSGEFPGPPAIVDLDKIPVPSFIIKELVEPLIGKVGKHSVLFMPCNFTDIVRIVEKQSQIEDDYDMPHNACANSEFPLVLVNCNIHNSAAQLAHLTIKSLEISLGVDITDKVIRNLLLGSSGLPNSLIQILKTLKGDPSFVIDFLKYFEMGTILNQDDVKQADEIRTSSIKSDGYLNRNIKTAREPEITKQWSQWSMLMGLIEKQLEPMRGDMWPASENIKPHEDRFRLKIREKAQEKGKNQLNFEELLEASRDLYGHNAIEPGKLIDTLLKRDRVWKI